MYMRLIIFNILPRKAKRNVYLNHFYQLTISNIIFYSWKSGYKHVTNFYVHMLYQKQNFENALYFYIYINYFLILKL